MKKAVVIGAGIGGLSAAIRLSAKGYQVTLLEKNNKVGGKVASLQQEGFRFDTGPSLFTMPALLDELFLLAGKNPRLYYHHRKLEESCRYFYEDGTVIKANSSRQLFAQELKEQGIINKAYDVIRYLKKSSHLFLLTKESFLFNSLHKKRNYFTWSFLKTILLSWQLDAFRTLHKANSKAFRDSRLVRLFDRYATFNGSSPYRAPATLKIIAHLEHNMGAYFPSGGMYRIATALENLALELNIRVELNTEAQELVIVNKQVKGIATKNHFYEGDLVVSDVDIHNFYRNILKKPLKKAITKQEPSSSALIFYWGINRSFPALGLHNILFSEQYKEEFDSLFKEQTLATDPTVYIFISSKQVETDAPQHCENWFVMVNAPINNGQDWETIVHQAREHILKKIQRTLGLAIEKNILCESVQTPVDIEERTGSFRGSLYGNSSNSRYAAFMRHANFHHRIKGLYFTGGSVHPGGGIPLCLASSKIIDKLIENDKKTYDAN